MKRITGLISGVAAIMLLIAVGCAPGPGGSASLEVPEGMESASFFVSGMI